MSVKKDLKILIVDDEPDVLAVLAELLPMYDVVKAGTFEEAKRQLETQAFDMAILDIMGVRGYELLEIAVAKKVTAVMFTAHALSPEDTVKSFRGGAAYYVPKDKMDEMPEILSGILEAKEKGRNTWTSFFDWADAYYSVKFGPRWLEAKKELQEKLK
ncbi:MAG: Response regulator receiver domain protein [Syntrophorhabdus sp. PtaU1.Bin050]|nr:MAG: Response regulator receiver domain protein [Syntrophorhabdus sp. PtaU1.Bin050]